MSNKGKMSGKIRTETEKIFQVFQRLGIFLNFEFLFVENQKPKKNKIVEKNTGFKKNSQ